MRIGGTEVSLDSPASGKPTAANEQGPFMRFGDRAIQLDPKSGPEDVPTRLAVGAELHEVDMPATLATLLFREIVSRQTGPGTLLASSIGGVGGGGPSVTGTGKTLARPASFGKGEFTVHSVSKEGTSSPVPVPTIPVSLGLMEELEAAAEINRARLFPTKLPQTQPSTTTPLTVALAASSTPPPLSLASVPAEKEQHSIAPVANGGINSQSGGSGQQPPHQHNAPKPKKPASAASSNKPSIEVTG